MKASLKKIFGPLGADGIVGLWLCVWWVCNLLQAGFTEIANDEAYYDLFARQLAWGYFDHPPVTALLAWAGEHVFGGELGLRFFFTLLQPLYLWILWRLIRPVDATRRDGMLFGMLAAATLMLQLYGFIAVPDGPLMMTAALFLLTFKWFSECRRGAWLWMGVAMAAMAYSKYHGALVVLFALAANLRLLRRPSLYLSGAVALLLLIPHLLWQYDHDWVSFAYHLSDRNSAFRPGHLLEFGLNMLVVFNPLFFPLYIKAWRAVQPHTALERALKWLPAGFFVFFLLSAVRGPVQPQWLIVAVFGLIYLLFTHARRHPRTRRYLMRAGGVTLVLVVLLRIEMIFNPLDIRYEIFDNPASYGTIADAAEGRPVVFRHRYSLAAKYAFYTGGEAYCQPEVGYRTHQWQFRDDDSRFAGGEVLIECPSGLRDSVLRVQTLHLANGRRFSYFVDPHFHPVRKVEVFVEGLPSKVVAGQPLHLALRLMNPYNYAIEVGSNGLQLAMVWRRGPGRVEEIPVDCRLTLPADGVAACEVDVRVDPQLAEGRYAVGFALRRSGYTHWFNGKASRVEIVAQ